jgi:hypothetical protein
MARDRGKRPIHFQDRQYFLACGLGRGGRQERLVGNTDSPLQYLPEQVVRSAIDLISGQRLEKGGQFSQFVPPSR